MSSVFHLWAKRLRGEQWRDVEETLVVEEPLEIRVGGRRYTATMRTPQGPEWDERLALGLLFSEGVIESLDDVENVSHRSRCRDLNQELVNVVDVTLHDETALPDELWERSIISNSSCGLCGKASVDAFFAHHEPLSPRKIDFDLLASLPDQMRAHQPLFDQTGGLHAAAIFSVSGELLACCEDIGRHNATDKALGLGLQNGWIPARNALILLVSGRASFEIVQKALRARISTLAAVSAPSSLAVELARSGNLNLVGFLRAGGMTVYSEAQ